MSKLAFGCSHTYGIGVDPEQAWPSLLDAVNYGVPGCSSDLIARTMPTLLSEHSPTTVYVLWPDWTRFEYVEHGQIKQSLATDANRINFMANTTDEWLQDNFNKQMQTVRKLCKDIKLIDMTLYDLIPYMDHADKWPLSKLGHHYDHTWHQQVADIFNAKT